MKKYPEKRTGVIRYMSVLVIINVGNNLVFGFYNFKEEYWVDVDGQVINAVEWWSLPEPGTGNTLS